MGAFFGDDPPSGFDVRPYGAEIIIIWLHFLMRGSTNGGRFFLLFICSSHLGCNRVEGKSGPGHVAMRRPNCRSTYAAPNSVPGDWIKRILTDEPGRQNAVWRQGNTQPTLVVGGEGFAVQRVQRVIGAAPAADSHRLRQPPTSPSAGSPRVPCPDEAP